MSDNWASFISLVNRGDWAQWDLTLDSTTADALNNIAGDGQIFIRYAVTTAGDVNQNRFTVMVNDWVGGAGEAFFSPATWNDAGRFVTVLGVGGAFGFPVYFLAKYSNRAGVSAGVLSGASLPWRAGANTVRVLNEANVPFDIDFVGVRNSAGGWSSTQFAVEAVPSGFATHVNGTAGSFGANTWFLKGQDVLSTGSGIGTATIDLEKLCPTGTPNQYTVTVHVDDGAADASGDVGVGDQYASVRATLDGTGRATLVVPFSEFPNPRVWYGGSDAIAPELTYDFPLTPIGCGGWHVGRIGMGS